MYQLIFKPCITLPPAIYIDQYYDITNFLDLGIEHAVLPTRLLTLMV